MITADQLLAHAIGDYVLQSHWMATEKTKRSLAALLHVVFYAIPFCAMFFPHMSLKALGVIVGTHFVIDRWRLARYVVWVKNFIGPSDKITLAPVDDIRIGEHGIARVIGNQYQIVRANPPWAKCKATGFSPDTPAWLAVWLLIIVDNLMHIVINGLALKYL